MPRRRNTAQRARNSMVKEGLLKADSSRGVWEVPEGFKGRFRVVVEADLGPFEVSPARDEWFTAK